MTITDPDTLRLAAIVGASEDAIISQSIDGIIETWNAAAERMFGYSAAEIIGGHAEVILAPEHRDREARLIDNLRRGHTVNQFDALGVTKSGDTIDLSISLSPLATPDGEMFGIAKIVRDVTTRKRLERDARRLAAIVDSCDDAIVSKDLNGIVQTWNRAAERTFGYSAEEMIGRSISTIIPKDRLSEEDEVLRRIRAGQSVEHFETIRQRKDGSLVEISLTVSPIRAADGRVIGASKIARDVSGQRQLARAAEEANRVKDEFLAMLSHELRTPLNAVLGYTRMLRNGHLPADRHDRAIDTIERNATMLSQLVSDVLDVSSIVTGKIRLKIGECDLRDIAEAAVEVVRPSADAKGVGLHLQQPGAPVTVKCDADRLQQVFWNLLVNAVKFTGPGGHIEMNVTRTAHRRAAVTVTDTGVGIRAEALPYIFHRFWQGERRSDANGGFGLGLGLSLARHFAELHGGTIQASSQGAGKGATFTVTLPLAGSEIDLVPPHADAVGLKTG